MKNKVLITLTSLLLCGQMTFAAADEQTVRWRLQTLWQPGTANQQAFERFADRVKDRTDGTVSMTVFPAGAVVGTNEMFDAARRGLLSGFHSATSYWTGRDPAFAVLGDLVGAYENPEQGTEYFYEHGGLDLLQQAYNKYDLHVIGVAYWGVESIPSNRSLASPLDLKGLKVRLPQGMSSDLFQTFGAAPVNMPGSEVFSALDSGAIDATDWGTLSMNSELGFHDRAKFAVYPGIHSMPVGDVVVSTKEWDKLSDRQKKILEEEARAFSDDMVAVLKAEDSKAAEELKGEGVNLQSWSAEDRQAFREKASEIWRRYGESSELSGQAVEGQIEYLKSVGLLK